MPNSRALSRQLLLVLLFPACSAVHAVEFCVSSEAEFTTALAHAQANARDTDGGTDEIRLRTGRYFANYRVDGAGWHIDVLDGNTNLTIVGGYEDVGCTVRNPDPSLTILDGEDAVRPLTIDSSEIGSIVAPLSIVVSGLTFENGRGDSVGALKISDPGPIYTGIIEVSGNIFRNNVATELRGGVGPGGLLAATDGPTGFGGGLGLLVHDNLFHNNTGPNAAAMFLFSNNDIAINNNTFVGNVSTDATTERLVIETFSFETVELNNNIFFANTPEGEVGHDLRARKKDSGEEYNTNLHANALQQIFGVPALEENTIAEDPLLRDPASGDFQLADLSPARNAGREVPLGGIGETDAAGNARVQEGRVDIGAFEWTGATEQQLVIAIDGAQAGNDVPASGYGLITIDTAANRLTYRFEMSGLSGAITAAHFHGPAARGSSAGAKIDISASPTEGVVVYDESDEADLLGGLWYVNFHTATHGSGEARGQLDIVDGLRLLQVALEGIGDGTVATESGEIECGAACETVLPAGSTITLTASAATGSRFAGWSGGCTGEVAQCVVVLDVSTLVTARFDPNASNGDDIFSSGFED